MPNSSVECLVFPNRTQIKGNPTPPIKYKFEDNKEGNLTTDRYYNGQKKGTKNKGRQILHINRMIE
jgi:hypothetical protein